VSWFRRLKQRIGVAGIIFLAGFVLFLLFYFTNQDGLAFLVLTIDIPFAAVVVFRGIRFVTRHSLWSLRNRLLFVYGLMGVLPILLLFALFGLSVWALMSELAIYLASSALNRGIQSIEMSVQAIAKIPPSARSVAISESIDRLSEQFPGVHFYVKDGTGDHRYPPTAPPLDVPKEWKNAHGILEIRDEFEAWTHHVDDGGEITAIAPLSEETLTRLVPQLGIIDFGQHAGAFESSHAGSIPPPMNKFDVTIAWASTTSFYRLSNPEKAESAVLFVLSRPSAVLRAFFSGTEKLRGVLYDAVIVIAILFLVVELVAAVIGVSLSRRITRAVNQLYEGTRRVTHGDFSHRISVRARDQLGELAQSFNQMTTRIQDLLIVEKEKERLETEIAIAREVQAQLYPKQAPPVCGLRLSVRCDPARMVSGDYYDYQVLSKDRLAFAIGDVAGKGISAALLMATLQAALKAQLTQEPPIREDVCDQEPEVDAATIVSRLNQQLYAHTSPEKYATFFFAVFDEATRTLTYTNAGHLAPLLIRNGSVKQLDSNGMVVGAFPFAKYDESCVTLQPGDLLVCYTDGVTEPENAYGEMFGEERMVELIRKHVHDPDDQIVSTVLDAVRSWTGSPELFDDMTLLLAREIQPS